MLAVVKLHDLGADDWLQRVVVIGKVGEGVLAPGTEFNPGNGYIYI